MTRLHLPGVANCACVDCERERMGTRLTIAFVISGLALIALGFWFLR